MITGAFAVIPVAITIFVLIYIENATRSPLAAIGVNVPGLGLVLAVLVIYLTGLFVSSLLGRFFLRKLDQLLQRLPLLRDLYKAWKQISFTPGGGEGIYARVVLVPQGPREQFMLAFSSLDPIAEGGDLVAVFLPNAPNPVTGRVIFAPRASLVELPISTDEAFKVLLSSGNYVPAELASRLPA